MKEIVQKLAELQDFEWINDVNSLRTRNFIDVIHIIIIE